MKEDVRCRWVCRPLQCWLIFLKSSCWELIRRLRNWWKNERYRFAIIWYETEFVTVNSSWNFLAYHYFPYIHNFYIVIIILMSDEEIRYNFIKSDDEHIPKTQTHLKFPFFKLYQIMLLLSSVVSLDFNTYTLFISTKTSSSDRAKTTCLTVTLWTVFKWTIWTLYSYPIYLFIDPCPLLLLLILIQIIHIHIQIELEIHRLQKNISVLFGRTFIREEKETLHPLPSWSRR